MNRRYLSNPTPIVAAVLLTLCAAISFAHDIARPQEPREVLKTEFGSEFSDGSSTIVGDSASFKLENGTLVLKMDSGRPVFRAAQTLQTRYGYMITYEDPPYTNQDDLQDVSAIVVRNFSQYAPETAPKVIVPKGVELTLGLPASALKSEDLAAALRQLVSAQAKSHRGGHFRLEQMGDIFHLIPTEVRDHTGNWLHYRPLLDTPISFPEQARTEAELYRAVAAAVSAARHVQVGVTVNGGWVVGMHAEPAHVIMGATREPARNVLMRALQLHGTRRTWALLSGPEDGDNVFNLNIWDFPAVTPATAATGP